MTLGPLSSAAAAHIATTVLDKGGKTYGGMPVWSPSNPGSVGHPVWVPGDQVAAEIESETGGSAEYARYVLSVAASTGSNNSSVEAMSWADWQKQNAAQKQNANQVKSVNSDLLSGGSTTEMLAALGIRNGTGKTDNVAASINAMKSKLESVYGPKL